jgi:molybdopterin converting factor small subunit
MKIRLRLFASLKPFAPAGASEGEIDLDVPEGATAQSVIDQLSLPPRITALVMIDGRHQTPEQVKQRPLTDGEVLAIAPPIAGG